MRMISYSILFASVLAFVMVLVSPFNQWKIHFGVKWYKAFEPAVFLSEVVISGSVTCFVYALKEVF